MLRLSALEMGSLIPTAEGCGAIAPFANHSIAWAWVFFHSSRVFSPVTADVFYNLDSTRKVKSKAKSEVT